MRMIFLAPLLALGLAACGTVPRGQYGQAPSGYSEPAPFPAGTTQRQAEYRAIGTEPFWDLTIGHDMVFTDRGTGVSTVEQAAPIQRGPSGDFYRGGQIDVDISHQRCSDGMSDRVYPDSVRVTVEGRPYRGCGGPAAMFQGGERGGPIPSPADSGYNLANTNWRVVAINGAPVPRSGYYLNFMPDRMSGRLGCNSIGAGYRVEGGTLRAGALLMTRMACPDSQFEAQGTRIMAQPMTLNESGDRMTLTNRLGTIEMMRAR